MVAVAHPPRHAPGRQHRGLPARRRYPARAADGAPVKTSAAPVGAMAGYRTGPRALVSPVPASMDLMFTLTLRDFEETRARIAPHIKHTPLLTSRQLSEATGFDVR